jgi:hypothetical protein
MRKECTIYTFFSEYKRRPSKKSTPTMIKTRLAQDASKNRNSGTLHATEVDNEVRPKIFSKERRLIPGCNFCSWMNKNKKPQNNKTLYCVHYFINAQFMPALASKCGSSSSSGWPLLV